MRNFAHLAAAMGTLGVFILIICVWVRRQSRKPVVYTLPASDCLNCGEVKRIWSDPWLEEPSHRYCSCTKSMRWDEWEERNKV